MASPATELAVYEFANLTLFGGDLLIADPSGGVEQDPRFLTPDIKKLLQSQHRLRFDRTNLRPREVKDRIVVFQAHGWKVYGHFLIDMMPKIALMRRAGHDLSALKFLVCEGTPQWQLTMLNILFSICPDQLIYFDPAQEFLVIEQALVGTCGRGDAGLHPELAGIFDELSAAAAAPGTKPAPHSADIFIDRRKWSAQDSYHRNITNLDDLFAIAQRRRAYELLDPSDLSIGEQMEMFRKAETVIGEYGSGLHNVVFSTNLQVCLCIGHINMLQSSICALRGAKIGFLSIDILQKDLTINTDRFGEFIERALP